ncbi:Tetratricopeptide repeat family protein [Borrelia crocidurae DOU]|nr:Tetratricopeptide repeat family protein [Borrelia crocidurae DOU]
MIEDNQEIKRSELSLEIIRKHPIQGTLFLTKNKIYDKLFPKIKVEKGENFYKLTKIILSIVSISFLLIAIFSFTNFKENIKLIINNSQTNIKKTINNVATYIDDIKINDKEKIKNYEGQFVFILTETEIKNSFQKIKSHLKNGKDNFARIEINKILNSNASESIKLKAKNLASFISSPDFITFDDFLILKEIKKNPLIYSDVYVKWEGIINNIEKQNNITYFDFYVGYNKDILEGIITTKINFDIEINFKDCVEILGQIKYEYNTNTLLLNAITIRKIKKEKE